MPFISRFLTDIPICNSGCVQRWKSSLQKLKVEKVKREMFFCNFREAVTQTKEDNHTNVPQPSVFLAGLRGGGMSEPTVLTKMDLTVDVDGRELAPSKRK